MSAANLTFSRSPGTKPNAARGKPALVESPEERFASLEGRQSEPRMARDYAGAILGTVPPLLILDDKLRVKMANESFCNWFKTAPGEAVDRLVFELGNGQWNIPGLRALLEAVVLRQEGFKDFEVTREFGSLGRRTLLLSARQVAKLPRILLFIDDVTERTETQAVIQASEIRYRRLFEAARDGILILDPDTRKITDANPFMEELLGYTHDELLGKELWEIGLLEDEEASRAAFRELKQKHSIRYENLPLQAKSGKHHEVEFVSNLYEEDGRVVIQCNIRDITERKVAEKALLEAKNEISRHAAHLEQIVQERTAQLRETIGELEAFSYSISHDMRAPLRAMQSYAQFLVEEYGAKLDEQGVIYLEQIMRSAVRLDRLIQDVLSYTRILHSPVPMERVDLDRLVRDIIATYPDAQPTQPRIQIQGKLPMVIGNEALLTQCVSNLLSNGLKFVSPGTTPCLGIFAEVIGQSLVRVWFKDNGIGIAPENHERIYQLFERIHAATDYEGTGLGLTIVRKAIERMGAQVGFDSELGQGTRFWLQLKRG